MTSETVLEVIEYLVGYIEPTGNATIDETRYNNQEKIIDLVANGIEDLINNSKYKDSTESSISKIGNRAYETLEVFYGWIKNNKDNIEK